MSSFRVPGRGRVDPARAPAFSFDGVAMTGLAGDTLASALLANGVRMVARSFKYHRPRGLLGAGVEEPNALMGVDRGPGRFTANVRATTIELHDGLKVETQNRWPSLGFDLGAANNLLSPLFPAGFYNKTFMWPRAAWEKVYEPAIRRMAGLGQGTRRDRSRIAMPRPTSSSICWWSAPAVPGSRRRWRPRRAASG